MHETQLTFDLADGERRKEEGRDLAALTRANLLLAAQNAAYSIAYERGEVSADDVYDCLASKGLNPLGLGNAAGCIFRTGFEFTGRWVKSHRASNHARYNRVWRLQRSR